MGIATFCKANVFFLDAKSRMNQLHSYNNFIIMKNNICNTAPISI